MMQRLRCQGDCWGNMPLPTRHAHRCIPKEHDGHVGNDRPQHPNEFMGVGFRGEGAQLVEASRPAQAKQRVSGTSIG